MPHPLDRSDMAAVIQRSPGQLIAGWNAQPERRLPAGPFSRILWAGMGGSWMAAALVAETQLARVPIAIHRGYGLPAGAIQPDTLVIACSFSGNTEETLSAYEEARKAGLPLVGIAKASQPDCRSELYERCRTDRVAFVPIPADPPEMQPRSATGYGVGILARLLERYAMAAEEIKRQLERLGEYLDGYMATARQRGEGLVETLRRATPIIYASQQHATVARIWKIKFNENAKTPAFWNVLPELNHNEMTGWGSRHGPFHVVLLSDPDEDSRILARGKILREVLADCGLDSMVVPMEGRTLVEKTFSTLLVGEWASYQLALALGVDPSPVPMVEQFKRRLHARLEPPPV